MNKEQSIQAAANHADRIHEDWTNQAFEKCKLILTHYRLIGVTEFQMCEIRRDIKIFLTELPEPPTKRAFGNVARLLRQAKLIEIVGYKPTNNLTAHNAIAANYRIL